MRAFESLSHRGQLGRLRQLATAALAGYDLRVAELRALEYRTNAVFLVRDTAGQRFVLRINAADHYRPQEIRSELLWLAALRQETGLPVPEPVLNSTGALVTLAGCPGVPQTRPCVVFRWLPGRFLKEQELMAAHLRAVGAFTARLHQHAERFVLPAGFTRPRWDWERAFGAGTTLASSRGAALLSAADQALVAAAARQVRAVMDALGSGPAVRGLIHSDLHESNYLFQRGQVGAIDFEDCGEGYYLFDMAVTLFEIHSRSDYQTLEQAYLEGYAGVRPLPEQLAAGLRAFTAMRIIELINWAGASKNPRLRAEFLNWYPWALKKLQHYVS